VSCIQYCVFLCCVFGLYFVCLVSSITPKTQHRNTYYWIQDTQRINQKHNTETRHTGYKTHNVSTKNTTQKHVFVSSITCFCVVFLVYMLCVLYPVLRVSVLCFWFIRCVSCIQYYVFLCCVFSLYVVCLVSSITCFCVVFLVFATQYWIQDTQRINQKHYTETRNTGYKTHNI
jgi:hypothetical protein